MDYKMTRWCGRACSYIKYKPDREAAEAELLAHIEDKYEVFVAAGMPAHDAVGAAVRSMGDADEVGRGLAKAHNPFFGYVLTATKVLLCVSLVCVLFAAFRARDRLGIHVPDAETAAAIDSPYTDDYRGSSDEGYSYQSTRTLYLEPGCSARSDGYTFTVSRIAVWYTVVESEESYDESFHANLTVKATHPLPWAGYPEAVRWFTATDSLGCFYDNMWSRVYTYEKALVGNPSVRTLFSYTYEMWLENYSHGAEWIELRYDRDGRDIALRIDLSGGK